MSPGFHRMLENAIDGIASERDYDPLSPVWK
jgi:hypothetical protein